MCVVRTKWLCLYVQCWKVFCSHTPSTAWELKVAGKRKTMRKMLSESLLVVWFNCATGFPVLMISTLKMFTVQSRLKIANNPNFDSTSIHCSAATARTKTNLLRDNISIKCVVLSDFLSSPTFIIQ